MKQLLFFVTIVVSYLIPTSVIAQEKWGLEKCVSYALQHNINVKQADVQQRFSALALKQSKDAQLPTFNFSTSGGLSFGLSNNPTTGILENKRFFNQGNQLQGGINLFNWFSKKNEIEVSRLGWEADKAQQEKIKNDIALNVAVAYLQVLLAREQVNISSITISQSRAQLESTRKQVDAGRLPDLNRVQVEAQQANDSSSYIAAYGTVQQFLLQLKALLNLDAGVAFDIETPPVELIKVLPLGSLQPEDVYALAVKNMPQQQVNEYKVQAANKSMDVAKSALYPTINAYGSLSTNYVNIKSPITSIGAKQATGATVNVGGTSYSVEAPSFIVTGYKTIPFFKQLRNNFGQNIGVGVSVPIFNQYGARNAIERARLNVSNMQLLQEQASTQLKQDIYKAYLDATTALQKFSASQKAVSTAQQAYDYAQKRYEVGLLNTYELLNMQSNLQSAQVQLLYNRFDYVFKIKLLEFYKGEGLNL